MNGGPAFPSVGEGFGDPQYSASGMSLRDYFAAHAPLPTDNEIDMQFRLDKARNPHNEPHKPRLRTRVEIIAALNYEYADAMLAARARGDA